MDGCLKLYRNTNNKTHNRVIKNPRLSERMELTPVTNIETPRSTIDRVQKKPRPLVYSERYWLTVLYHEFQYWYQISYLGSGILPWELVASPFGGYGLPTCGGCFATSRDVPSTGLTPVIKRE